MEWSREQEIVALYLYCLIPFNKVIASNPHIAKMAELIGRPNANSLKAKIGNFGKFDNNLAAKGLGHSSHLDEEIWIEYCGRWQELETDALLLIESFQNANHQTHVEVPFIPTGIERETIIRTRSNQHLFRNMVLSAYNSRCCITRIANPELIEACHIIGWAEDESNRINPCNGLAMNVLFHRAFDKQLLGISPDLKVVISDKLYDGLQGKDKEQTYKFFNPYHGTEVMVPKKFKPNLDFIEQHYNAFLKAI